MIIIKEIKKFINSNFNFEVQIVNEQQKKDKKTKWAEFGEKMDGLFTPDIIEHIAKSRKEARDNFTVNN